MTDQLAVKSGKTIRKADVHEVPEAVEEPVKDDGLSIKRVNASGRGEVTKEEFMNQFRRRYVCSAIVSMTDQLAVKGGKTIRRVDVNEVLEAV